MARRFFLLLSILIFLAPIGHIFALTDAEQEAEWRAELAQTEADIAKWQSVLDGTKANTASLQNEVKQLNAKIQQAKLFIKKKNIAIGQLDQDIAKKNANIKSLEQKIDDGHDSLAQLLRKTNEIDKYSLVEVMLGNKNISDFFSDIDTFQSVNKSLADLFVQIRQTKDLTEKEKAALDVQKNKELDTKKAAEVEQKQVQDNEKQKEYLVNVSKTQEKTYQQILSERQKRAAEIRAALFKLRDTAAIPFGDALRYAQAASAKTGVRPAFLLAILTQESNLGQNVGSCMLSSIDSGDGIGKNTGTLFEKVMKSPRDTVPFQAITGRLGLDWKTTPVSCPLGTKYSSSRGYGGGMGPSQFIPSTWELFKDDVGSMLGISADSADPWNPEHAFMATAIYMRDLGAVSGSYTAERNAACKYYSGSACSSTRRPPNISYGNSVMSIAENIQTTMIDPLQNL
jgi:peptidoglycan hydrolase CwlO-like protein